MIVMIIYFVQQYKHSQSNIVSEARKQELLKKSIRNGMVNISGYLCNEIDVGSHNDFVWILDKYSYCFDYLLILDLCYQMIGCSSKTRS